MGFWLIKGKKKNINVSTISRQKKLHWCFIENEQHEKENEKESLKKNPPI